MYMRIVYWIPLLLGLCFSTPLHAQDASTNDPIERQVIVMFQPDKATLPGGLARAELGQAELPTQVKGLLQRHGARSMGKGFPEFQRSDTLRTLRNGRKYRVPDYTNLFVITLPSGTNRDSVVAQLNQLPASVKYAEKNQRPAIRPYSGADDSYLVSPSSLSAMGEVIPPNQDDFDQQWGLRNTIGPDIEATEAWNYTTGSSNITIGIVDSGVEGTHVDLSGKVSGYSTPTNDHGTSVAGIAAAKGDNFAGKVAGVDWRAQIHSEPLGGLATTAQSIQDAVLAGASVINNSWGYANRSATLTQALRSAYEADVLLVHANPYSSGSANATSPYPNNVGPWIVNVGSMTQSGAASSYTASRSFTDLGAPGDDIYTTTLGSGHNDKTGTSFAAPFVTGAASLLLAAEPNLRNYDIEHLLKRTAQSYGSGFDPKIGYGMIDANAALEEVSAPNEVDHGTASFTKIYNDDSVNFLSGFRKSNGAFYGAGTYICDIYKLNVSASFYYKEAPSVWLPVTEDGFSAANPNNGDRYLSKSVSKSSAQLTTFFYYVESNINGQEIGWVPFDPTAFRRGGSFEYTVIGEPDTPPLNASISGPNITNSGTSGTWSASYSGGAGTVSYDWDYRSPGSSSWSSTSCSGSSCTLTFYNNSSSQQQAAVRATVSRGTQSDAATKSVAVSPSCSPGSFFCTASKEGLAIASPDIGVEGKQVRLSWNAAKRLAMDIAIEHRTSPTDSWKVLEETSVERLLRAKKDGTFSYSFRTSDLDVGEHEFRLSASHAEGNATRGYSKVVSAQILLDDAYELTAYPNPVQQSATVELAVQEQQDVSVRVYDVLGRQVTTLHNGPLRAQQTKRLVLNPARSQMASGTYFVRVTGEEFVATERITVVR